jgi:hypothetical protein
MALANLGLLRDHWCRGNFTLSHLINEVIDDVFGICRVSHHLLNQALGYQRILLGYFLDYLLSGRVLITYNQESTGGLGLSSWLRGWV